MARRARRTFTPEFKAKVVLDVLTGTASQAEVCRKHQISPSLFAFWKATLLERLPGGLPGRRGQTPEGRRGCGGGMADLRVPASDGDAPPGQVDGQPQADSDSALGYLTPAEFERAVGGRPRRVAGCTIRNGVWQPHSLPLHLATPPPPGRTGRSAICHLVRRPLPGWVYLLGGDQCRAVPLRSWIGSRPTWSSWPG